MTTTNLKGRRHRKNKTYSHADKVAAVAAIKTVNPDYHLTEQATTEARQVIGMNVGQATLRSWEHELGEEVVSHLNLPTNAEIVRSTQDAIIGKWAGVEQRALKRLDTDAVIDDTKGRDLAIIAGISRTHLNKLTELEPDERTMVLQIKTLTTGIDLSFKDALSMLIDRLTLYRQQRAQTVIDALDNQPPQLEPPSTST